MYAHPSIAYDRERVQGDVLRHSVGIARQRAYPTHSLDQLQGDKPRDAAVEYNDFILHHSYELRTAKPRAPPTRGGKMMFVRG